MFMVFVFYMIDWELDWDVLLREFLVLYLFIIKKGRG